MANRAELNQFLEKAFHLIDYNDLMDLANKHQITLAPINNLKDVFEIPAAKELILEEKMTNSHVSKRVKTTVFKLLSE